MPQIVQKQNYSTALIDWLIEEMRLFLSLSTIHIWNHIFLSLWKHPMRRTRCTYMNDTRWFDSFVTSYNTLNVLWWVSLYAYDTTIKLRCMKTTWGEVFPSSCVVSSTNAYRILRLVKIIEMLRTTWPAVPPEPQRSQRSINKWNAKVIQQMKLRIKSHPVSASASPSSKSSWSGRDVHWM